MLPSLRIDDHQYAVRWDQQAQQTVEEGEGVSFIILPRPFPIEGTVLCVVKTRRKEGRHPTEYLEKVVIFTESSFPPAQRNLAIGFLENAKEADANRQEDAAFAVDGILQTYVSGVGLLDPF
jgi:hypothetical protein